MNIKTSRKILDQFEVKIPTILPTKINLVCDATFFRKRKDKDGLLIFFDSMSEKVIWYKFIQSETKAEYQEGLDYLLQKGFDILSVTIDGRRGIPGVFKAYPLQLCQFHIQKRVRTLITQNPKSQAGKELKQINSLFIKNRLKEQELGETLGLYCKRNFYFLSQRNDQGDYKHKRIIQALRCYKRNIRNLFTFQKYLNLNIPNTTNDIDGGINTKLKDLNRRHRGMNISRRNKLLINLVYNLKVKR